MNSKSKGSRWLAVAGFAVAMAWMESAVVLYLRTLMNRLEPYQATPLPAVGGLAFAELVREAATLSMLALVGWLEGQTWRSRLGFFLLAFGIWGLGHYVFLVPLTGWPRSVLDWDVLFLIPLPWWGPMLAPILIALLMVGGGSLLALGDTPERPLWPSRWAVAASLTGAGLALYVFMADAIAATFRGGPSLRELLPVRFNWPLFLPAVTLPAVPVAELGRLRWHRRDAARAPALRTSDRPNPSAAGH
jgi:hypothetical protein